ncbi:MAG TPA: hypothetical protein VKU83_11480 [Puia sp.]|nr:hypothetical protein [Puia sp.]
MKRSLIIACISILSGTAIGAAPAFQSFDKARFYSVMASGKIGAVDSELSIVAVATVAEKEAYEGALLMRKAGLLSGPREKLVTFRSGAVKLERSLARDSANAEYHFLRLMIQEHAPAIVHYNKDKERDSRVVIRAFPRLPPVLQNAIRDYWPYSRTLQETKLNG